MVLIVYIIHFKRVMLHIADSHLYYTIHDVIVLFVLCVWPDYSLDYNELKRCVALS